MRSSIAILAIAASIAAFVSVAQHRANADQGQVRMVPAAANAPVAAKKAPPGPPPLTGVEIDKLVVQDGEVLAPAAVGRTAHLSIDPNLQRATTRILRQYAFPEAAVVVLETGGGRVLTWASHIEKGPPRDLCVEATAPAASVFKIVTGAALVETAGLLPEAKQCYAGGESRITALDLVDDPRRDRWCATLGEAMGRSINAVFAKLALKNLTPADLNGMGGAFGFGDSVPFDIPVATNGLYIPEDKLGFARTAAGFWNTTMSPLEAATIANTVANQGEMLRPVIVESVADSTGSLYQAPKRTVIRRAILPETAAALTSMMETTVRGGTSRRAFHDAEGRAFLPNIAVAGKTGTLTRAETQQFYTWFVGFAPSRAPEVAIAVLVVNTPSWRAKANVVAREVLRAYFAAKGAPGVTRP
jgi:peptidoglycan glycosyltransferase